MIERLYRRVLGMLGRGRVTASDDSGVVQRVQVMFNDLDIHDQILRVMEYGFTSRPHANCDALAVFLSGDRSNGVIIGTNDQRYRLRVQEGEVALYDDLGQSVHLTRTGIVVRGGGLPMLIENTPQVTIDSNLTVTGLLTTEAGIQASTGGVGASISVTGNVTVTGDVTANGTSLHTHRHTSTTAGTPTSTPI